MTMQKCSTASCTHLTRKPGKCSICRYRRNRKLRDQYHQRIANGLCGPCGRPLDGRSWNTCTECQANTNTTRRTITLVRKESNVCKTCGKQPPCEGGTTCESCRAKKKSYNATYKEKKKNGKTSQMY